MIKNRIFFFIFFLTIISLIIFRSPCLFIENSLRSFDRTVFYNFSANNNFLDSIFYVYPYASYFELWINIASKFATFFPFCIVLTSGSCPKLPKRITLFTEPAIY